MIKIERNLDLYRMTPSDTKKKNCQRLPEAWYLRVINRGAQITNKSTIN